MTVKDAILNHLRTHPSASYSDLIQACSQCSVKSLYSSLNAAIAYLLNNDIIVYVSNNPDRYAIKE